MCKGDFMEVKEEQLDMYGQIAGLYKSKEYMAITAYYDQKNIFEILGVPRREDVHSNFLAWLLNPNESHGYGTFPLQQFLRLIALAAKTYPCNKEIPVADIDAQFLDELLIGTKTVASASIIKREKRIENKKRMDLVLEVCFEDDGKTLPVIIENKVKSDEHSDDKDKQSNYYYKWAEEKYVKSAESTRYEKPLFVFLSPKYDAQSLAIEERKGFCVNDSYILISYQDIMEHLLEPCKEQDGSEYAKSLIKDYMRCLSDSEKEKGDVMATENETKELLREFWNKNEDLFLKMMKALVDDDAIDDDSKGAIKDFAASIENKRDKTKYIFNGDSTPLPKNQLVKAVVKQYVNDNPKTTLEELSAKFPQNLQGSLGVFKEMSKIQDNSSGRYYCNDPITLSDGKVVAVCNQWGKPIIDWFVDHVTKKLGYTITEVE